VLPLRVRSGYCILTGRYNLAPAPGEHELHDYGDDELTAAGLFERRLMTFPGDAPDLISTRLPAEVDVLVVGAGITGIYQLYRAREAGFSAQLLEAGDGVGGTWYWNRYPGARFDSESYTYGYLFSKELFEEWEWEEHFAQQPEIERYLNHVVDRFDLRRHIRFGASVTSAVYDERSGRWTVSTAEGTELRTRFLVAATGVLSVPYYPEVQGREDFRGESHHTGMWPSSGVDFAGKRVAVVGTGSSGVQIIPAIAGEVASLTVYQRTANWCTPLNNAPITSDEQARLRAGFQAMCETLNTSPSGFLHPAHDRTAFDDSEEQRREFYESMWGSPGFSKLTSNYTDLLLDQAANDTWCEFIAHKIRNIVKDPATAEKLIPKDHRFGEKRPPFVTDYYEVYNNPKVSLVDLSLTPILRMTDSGIETADGARELDIVVWATGFDFGTGALARMGVVGRYGLALRDHWADGPKTFLGVQTTGFPNFFFPGGPHAAAGNNPRYNGDQVDFITGALVHLRAQGCDIIEVDAEAEEKWTNMVDRWATRPPSFAKSSYYFGTNIPGKASKYLLNSAGRPKLLLEIDRVLDSDYKAFRLSRSSDSALTKG
jgi:cation diffusion facilitator CzcD-associated flavoprotein CzcO